MFDEEVQAPFISIPGVLNFRDIGGYPIPAQPHTEAGCERIRQLGIAAVYDLRSEQEVAGAGPCLPLDACAGVEKILAPVFREDDYSPEAVALRFKTHRARPEGFAEAYSAILAAAVHPENSARPYARSLEHLAVDARPEPILIHCQAGKDRTAVICALILSLCGVADDVIADEYSLTDIGLASCHEQLIANLLSKEEFHEDPQSARQMVLARRDNMLFFLRELKRKHGSVEQGVIDMKLLKAEGIKRLISNMIVDVTN
ncbi:tyrosine phosphatase [Astrocystis sublimbata]|nr:tyrosine phosphatase [Astrocystis sublimbata]